MPAKPENPTVEIVDSRYQPTKAELEEDVRLTDGGPVTMEEFTDLARNLVRTVDIRGIKRPKR